MSKYTTDFQVVGIVGAVLRCAEPAASLEDFALSSSTAWRARQSHRPHVAREIREQFQPPTYSVIHWDGSMVEVSDIILQISYANRGLLI